MAGNVVEGRGVQECYLLTTKSKRVHFVIRRFREVQDSNLDSLFYFGLLVKYVRGKFL